MKEEEVYCVKCKKKQMAKNLTHTVLKNGRDAMKGECSVCGTKVMKFVAKA